ncbi:hypothetical protein ACFL4T_01560 [candidate division KSB1 bacterium]
MKTVRILIIFIFIAFISGILPAQEADLSQFEHLKNPKISVKKDMKVLVVEAKGNPNVIGGQAFGLLFQLYYMMKDTPKGPMQPAPRARWPVDLESPKSDWTGFYALPVPEKVTELPPIKPPQGLKASLTTWEYGEVVEILHIGPYDKEEPTVKKLMDFVKEQGYEVFGRHEEEYLKGPTMAGPGDPEKYQTIIRYRVKKANK